MTTMMSTGTALIEETELKQAIDNAAQAVVFKLRLDELHGPVISAEITAHLLPEWERLEKERAKFESFYFEMGRARDAHDRARCAALAEVERLERELAEANRAAELLVAEADNYRQIIESLRSALAERDAEIERLRRANESWNADFERIATAVGKSWCCSAETMEVISHVESLQDLARRLRRELKRQVREHPQ